MKIVLAKVIHVFIILQINFFVHDIGLIELENSVDSLDKNYYGIISFDSDDGKKLYSIYFDWN